MEMLYPPDCSAFYNHEVRNAGSLVINKDQLRNHLSEQAEMRCLTEPHARPTRATEIPPTPLKHVFTHMFSNIYVPVRTSAQNYDEARIQPIEVL
jgi:hypothetical protein